MLETRVKREKKRRVGVQVKQAEMCRDKRRALFQHAGDGGDGSHALHAGKERNSSLQVKI